MAEARDLTWLRPFGTIWFSWLTLALTLCAIALLLLAMMHGGVGVWVAGGIVLLAAGVANTLHAMARSAADQGLIKPADSN